MAASCDLPSNCLTKQLVLIFLEDIIFFFFLIETWRYNLHDIFLLMIICVYIIALASCQLPEIFLCGGVNSIYKKFVPSLSAIGQLPCRPLWAGDGYAHHRLQWPGITHWFSHKRNSVLPIQKLGHLFLGPKYKMHLGSPFFLGFYFLRSKDQMTLCLKW